MEDGNRIFTVDEALVEMGFGKFQLCVLAYAGMGMVAEAMKMMLLSFVGPAVQSLWNLSSQEENRVSFCDFVLYHRTFSWLRFHHPCVAERVTMEKHTVNGRTAAADKCVSVEFLLLEHRASDLSYTQEKTNRTSDN